MTFTNHRHDLTVCQKVLHFNAVLHFIPHVDCQVIATVSLAEFNIQPYERHSSVVVQSVDLNVLHVVGFEWIRRA